MPSDGSPKTGAADVPAPNGPSRLIQPQTFSLRPNIVKTSWWRRNFADNFSLEYELDAKIDQLKILLADLPDSVVPSMSEQMRKDLQLQLQSASMTLKDCEPLEPCMRRINFVEREIIRRLSDEHVDLALETLRAQVSISLPEPASKAMLAEIDKVAVSAPEATSDAEIAKHAASLKIKLVGLKTRLNEAVMELFRGGERTRNATHILGVALISLTLGLSILFCVNNNLSRALFTHYGTTAIVQPRTTGTTPSLSTSPPTVVPPPYGQQGTRAAETPKIGEVVQVVPNGEAPLISLAFPVVLMATAFGGIGACLSGLFSFTLQDRVPTEYEGYFRTLIRPVIGIASGFLAVFILRSGLFTFGDDLAWVAIVALAFGFSERLFMGTAARLENLPK